MGTAREGQTQVQGAGVLVLAVQVGTADALAALALIHHSAGIEIVANALVGGKDASRGRDATVIRARIAVRTGQVAARLTGAGAAGVPHRTQVVVVTRCGVGFVAAPGARDADILGAGVVVVAAEGAAPDAISLQTLVLRGADILVAARRVVGLEAATGEGVAAVIRARISVLAIRCGAGLTPAVDAEVALGAGVAVAAWSLQGIIRTAPAR